MNDSIGVAIQEITVKKYKAPDGTLFDSNLEAVAYAKECLKPKVHIIFKSVLAIGNSITIEGVYDNLFMAEQCCESLKNLHNNNVSFYVKTFNVIEASKELKASMSIPIDQSKSFGFNLEQHTTKLCDVADVAKTQYVYPKNK